MTCFIQDEFSNRVIENSNVKIVEEIDEKMNKDNISAIDGKLIEVCDKLSAYIEASLTLRYGIHSEILDKSKEKLYLKFANTKIAKLNFKDVFDYFKTNNE
ncbi:MAG: HAD family hydrolase, partial [Endomicrobiia bacterium]